MMTKLPMQYNFNPKTGMSVYVILMYDRPIHDDILGQG